VLAAQTTCAARDFFCAVTSTRRSGLSAGYSRRLLRIRRGRSIHRPGARTTQGYRLAAVQINPDSATAGRSFTTTRASRATKSGYATSIHGDGLTHSPFPLRSDAQTWWRTRATTSLAAACFPLQPNPAPCRSLAFAYLYVYYTGLRRRIAFVLSLSSTVVIVVACIVYYFLLHRPTHCHTGHRHTAPPTWVTTSSSRRVTDQRPFQIRCSKTRPIWSTSIRSP